jgi:RHS repeat-associated protein
LIGLEARHLRHDLANNLLESSATVHSQFFFDAAGSRARQLKTRTALSGSLKQEVTLYLGSYEREIHSTAPNSSTTPVEAKRVHRHSLGDVIYTRTITPTEGEQVRLTTKLDDHLGSTDVLLTALWNNTSKTFTLQNTEYQAFDPWGERANVATASPFRQNDADPFRRSAQDYDRGYTGHEQLDDSGLIHMNGRIYDPELGRMLSPDPYVQVPEYSQNFNRYSYVLNNPLNKTDPTGYSWLSKAFHKIGSWFKENWRVVVAVVLSFAIGLVAGALAKMWAATTMAGMNVAAGSAAALTGTQSAIAAAVGSGVGAFWGSLTSNLIMGQNLDEAILDSLKVGAIAAVTTFTIVKGLEFAVKHTNPLDKAELYKIDAKTGKPVRLNADQMKIPLKGKHIFTNGINNSLEEATENAIQRMGRGEDRYLIYNPTNGSFRDLLESGLDKFGGQSKIAQSTADLMLKFDIPSTTIYAHSQGTLIMNSALNINSMRTSIAGARLASWGAAQNGLSEKIGLGSMGVNVAPQANHPFDAVGNIVGLNSVTIPNPYRAVGSLIAAPTLFMNRETFSPHGSAFGGRIWSWAPWLYSKHKTPPNYPN